MVKNSDRKGLIVLEEVTIGFIIWKKLLPLRFQGNVVMEAENETKAHEEFRVLCQSLVENCTQLCTCSPKNTINSLALFLSLFC